MDWPTEIGTFCFLRNEGRTLFFYRNRGKNDMHQGFYVPPGGHFNRGERGIDCVEREFKEETGLIIKPRLRQIVMFYNKDRVLGGRTDKPDWYVEVFEANEFRGKLKPEKKGDKLVWVKDSRLSRLRRYDCDKVIFGLLDMEGIYETRFKYRGHRLVRISATRVD